MAAPAFGSIGTFTQTVSGTVSFPVPAGVASGDVIVIAVFLDSTATVTAMPPGFAHAPNSPVSAGNHSLAVMWKRATGADAGTYDFTLSGSVYREGAAIRYTGCVAAGSPWDTPTASASGTTSSTVTPAVNVTTLGADRLVFFAATNWSGGAWTPPAGFVERIDNPPNRTLTADDVVQAAAGSTGDVTATCAGSDRRTAWLGALIGTGGGSAAPVGASDLVTSWRVAARVTSDLVTSWRVYTPVASTDLTTNWRVFAPVGSSDLATSWRALARVTADLATLWRVSTAVGPTDMVTSWRVYAPVVAADLATSWRVLSSLTSVASDLVTSWRVAARVTSDLTTSWRGSALVASDLTTSWRVHVPVGASDLATSWRVLQAVVPVGPTDLGTSWKVYVLVDATDLITAWRVLIPPVTLRPFTGLTVRSGTGTITRPDAGITARP